MAKLEEKATKKTGSTDAAPLADPNIGLFQMLCCEGDVYRLNPSRAIQWQSELGHSR